MNDDTPDLGDLGHNLVAYEQKYGLLSPDFLRLYRAGELPEDRDFVAWAWLCEERGIEPAPRR